ncbi:uncharacterized protein LOC111372894 [Olea europaea var. sylvestris]|uniref:uncharacterized protein LOC111372894 n=1 Tax=Olea europaea var. sylvestris TaxID=158386 RepID=UPI000C1D6EE5|nr:uncharacterized protein LOC111372894 [Olea europaea var. sylvestris]XP_022851088.1 uncharacterized protein LOC111372894 [Olea europaea var. sylvestris]XP_022851089.1 uncharacterized protein LOC111372894 [Olea europaea var. sylvestris]
MSPAHAPNPDSSYLSGASESGNSDVGTSGTSCIHSNNTDMRERGKSSLRVLYFKGVGYHLVNCCLFEREQEKPLLINQDLCEVNKEALENFGKVDQMVIKFMEF